MFNFNRTLIYLKTVTPLSPNPNPLFHPYPSLFSLHFCTNTSDSISFAVSYLIHNFGFSPQPASKLCSNYRLQFNTSQNPDSVLTFFRNHNFSHSQLRHIVEKATWLLSCNPSKRVLPKFQFLLSKGASNSDIVNLVSKNPRVLSPSLKSHIVPTYELVYRFLQSDKDTLACVFHNPSLLIEHIFSYNIRMLIENRVSDSNIARLLRVRSRTLSTLNLEKLLEELQGLGFDLSKIKFSIALIAKTSVTKTRWKEKVDTFKKWGWSDEDVAEAFKKQPYCMLTSIDKINLVMNFWVNQLGWDAMAIAKSPGILLLSLEKRIIPRAIVVQFLLDKGLRNMSACLTSPFFVHEKMFLSKFIKCFENESSYLLELYEKKLNLAYTSDTTCMS
ncbi:uncharacterized protein LOC131595188 [Vicia villosa]|uniref:uncharacterized protein LOC131595188 n=1 Tax=Vicia villosa TaxID=3911 RepID=UPI00273BE504|nr:uncharacterized protein LOC131595188 [Vicia villosa]XP_058723464.1 uncharacterized protein LOC131595188 [Vicia villosa]